MSLGIFVISIILIPYKSPVVIPPKAELKAFDESIQAFFADIRNLRAENDRLATVRDSILPRLMSGELDLSDLDF